jgi:hypothetical protein
MQRLLSAPRIKLRFRPLINDVYDGYIGRLKRIPHIFPHACIFVTTSDPTPQPKSEKVTLLNAICPKLPGTLLKEARMPTPFDIGQDFPNRSSLSRDLPVIYVSSNVIHVFHAPYLIPNLLSAMTVLVNLIFPVV